MEDLTLTFREVMSKDVLWSVNVFFEVVELFKAGDYQISFWEDEENWGTISYKSIDIGYMWRKYPLFFVVSAYTEEMRMKLIEYEFITFIQTDDLDKKGFKISPDVLKDERDLDIDFEEFSANDLWFSTISR